MQTFLLLALSATASAYIATPSFLGGKIGQSAALSRSSEFGLRLRQSNAARMAPAQISMMAAAAKKKSVADLTRRDLEGKKVFVLADFANISPKLTVDSIRCSSDAISTFLWRAKLSLMTPVSAPRFPLSSTCSTMVPVLLSHLISAVPRAVLRTSTLLPPAPPACPSSWASPAL